MHIAIRRARWCRLLAPINAVGVIAACGSSGPSNAHPASLPTPCTFLTQTIAARINGDTRITKQATKSAETQSGYVACIFADTLNEGNSVEVQIKKVSGGVKPSTLQAAASFFSLGEPVEPFRRFSVVDIGDSALGESTPGVAFIVFSDGDFLVYVGARSASASVRSLQAGDARLAATVAAAL